MDDSHDILESLKQSLVEIKLIREGKLPKRSFDDLLSNINEWNNEDNECTNSSTHKLSTPSL